MVILLVIILFQTYTPMLAMEQDTKQITLVKEDEYPLYQKAISAVRESDDSNLPSLLATINPNAQITHVPGNPCRIHFLLTFALYENKNNATRHLLDAGADPLLVPLMQAEGEQEHAQTILVDALNLNCPLSAEIVLSHIPRPLLIKYGSKAALKHLLLCFRRIKSDLPRDIRTLLCRYCVTACVQDEQLERAKHFCKNTTSKQLTCEGCIEEGQANMQCFEVSRLSRFYPVWQEQVITLLNNQMNSH